MKKTGIIAFTGHGCVLGEKLLRDLQKQNQEVYGFVKSKYVEPVSYTHLTLPTIA